MNEAEKALAALAARQRQVFTREQARAAGLSFNAITRRLQHSDFVAVGSRTLTFGGVTLDWYGELAAGLLDIGRGTLVSAEAAAALLGLDGYDPGPLVFLAPRELRWHRTRGAVATTRSINGLDRKRVDGFPCTSGTRTVIELLGRVPYAMLGNALDTACRKGLIAERAVVGRLGELGRQGRKGVADLDRLLADGGVQSWLERLFFDVIRSTGLPKPAAQRLYYRDGVHVARVDFDFDPLPIIVEVGGRRGYLSFDERRRQERRRNELQLLGRIVYFFTREDVTTDQDYVVATLRSALRAA
jgi:hypothetical protein